MISATVGRRVVVVGAGPAAHHLVTRLAASDAAERGLDVLVLGDEPHAPYDRVNLAKRFEGAGVDLTLGDGSVWAAPGVRLAPGTLVTAIDADARTVTTTAGEHIPFDDLVLATGSRARVPEIPHADRGRVLRTLEDVDGLCDEIVTLRRRHGRDPNVVVVGGGLLGIEAAGSVADAGCRVTVVHSGRWPLSAQLDEAGGRILEQLLRAQAIALALGARPTEVLVGPSGAVTGVSLTDGTQLHADLVVFAIGIQPRDELARAAGLRIDPKGGVVIDASCATSVPRIWAIGEVAAFDGRTVGLAAPGNAMAETVADRLTGGDAVYAAPDESTSLKLAGVQVAVLGSPTPGVDDLEVVYANAAAGIYQKLIVGDDALTLRGGAFVGDASPFATLRAFVGDALPAEPAAFLAAAGADAPEVAIPDAATVCTCHAVTAGALRAHVADGCHDLTGLKSCSRAGTQCGSCVPLVKTVLDEELRSRGIEVSKALCEHVTLSRVELFESVRALGLSTVGTIVERFVDGGVGCDICKPVIASIVATQTHAHPLDDGAAGFQDTNDRALANLQKDGTYSVVPRVPAGEISPEKLAVIAEVATEFGLYTKITGAQRIDMFGARLEQLPLIWKRLVDAGMESGQAYGKSLRTVKSCVGSTWCRYGVLDSVGMAVRLELRYRGLRSPHKIKLGVSGCARECAEARSKDIGVIATSDGWNLYVGGNGGMTPVHAELLAQNLDDDTLIRYIDRYMMYYIRTADRLQRTARWQEQLPGGLEHVRQVVCEDSLGIAAELEEAMAQHVEDYEDEWAATLADPERLRRFQSFVNAVDAPDPEVVHVPDGRGQHRPATESERLILSGTRIPVRGR
ncbi:nitrite reductase large subunit NirB [Microbacterium sp. SORGH_AS_0888]|uniref:nitrite reductase large subunit NirB n=1 Tax=Microbacterium sp. SORGH_AS_0888 TaxID=3041791 RepID=UPI00277EEB4E|nr:nitrite reductase large subunit NirB [Microbacterium sp. SORGH_AS_0888]MDQ1130359.1 nitrite reductase (NADH) large subunit [Microbacterium sp. SORGH_AS_0888]